MRDDAGVGPESDLDPVTDGELESRFVSFDDQAEFFDDDWRVAPFGIASPSAPASGAIAKLQPSAITTSAVRSFIGSSGPLLGVSAADAVVVVGRTQALE